MKSGFGTCHEHEPARRRQRTDNQAITSVLTKGGLLGCKRLPFTASKVAFCMAKCRLLPTHSPPRTGSLRLTRNKRPFHHHLFCVSTDLHYLCKEIAAPGNLQVNLHCARLRYLCIVKPHGRISCRNPQIRSRTRRATCSCDCRRSLKRGTYAKPTLSVGFMYLRIRQCWAACLSRLKNQCL